MAVLVILRRVRPAWRCVPLLLLVVALGGCMPHVMHGARVERGTTGGVSGHFGRNVATGRGSTIGLTFYAGMRHGWVSADDRSALLLGAQVSPLLVAYAVDNQQDDDFVEVALATSYGDVYVQPRGMRNADWNGGLGALFSSAVFAPYMQFAGKRGWYTTQMLAFTHEPLAEQVWLMPSVAWREPGRPGSRSALHVQLGAAIPMTADSNDLLLLISITAELGLPRDTVKR